MKFIKLVFSLSILLLVTAGCQTSAVTSESNVKEELIPINVGYLPTTGHSLYYIAAEQGYFEAAGLDVTFSLFNNSGEGINAVAAGQLDIGTFGTAAPLNFAEAGADILFFGGQMGTGAGVVAKPELADELTNPVNFKGKTVATVALATGDVVWRGALFDAGLDWKEDVTIVEMQRPNDVIVAVNQGEVDAGVVWVPFVETAIQEGLEIVAYSGSYLPEHVCGRIITNTKKFEEEPELFVAFMEAMIKAENFLQDESNKEEAIDNVAQYVDVDPEVIEKDLYEGYLIQTADPDKNAILAFQDTMINIGYLEGDRDISEIIDIEVYKQALDNVIEQNPDVSYYEELIVRYEENNF